MVYDDQFSLNNELGKVFKIDRILLCLIEEEMELTFRSQKCLDNAEIKLIGQLVQKSASELLELPHFGKTSICDIEKNLAEIGLTLEMTLNFPPWNGDHNGDELINIMSLQKLGGGFHVNGNAVKMLGIDLKKVKQDLQGGDSDITEKKLSILQTKYLLNLLESKFEKDMPYLMDLLKPHRKWTEKELGNRH